MDPRLSDPRLGAEKCILEYERGRQVWELDSKGYEEPTLTPEPGQVMIFQDQAGQCFITVQCPDI